MRFVGTRGVFVRNNNQLGIILFSFAPSSVSVIIIWLLLYLIHATIYLNIQDGPLSVLTPYFFFNFAYVYILIFGIFKRIVKTAFRYFRILCIFFTTFKEPPVVKPVLVFQMRTYIINLKHLKLINRLSTLL